MKHVEQLGMGKSLSPFIIQSRHEYIFAAVHSPDLDEVEDTAAVVVVVGCSVDCRSKHSLESDKSHLSPTGTQDDMMKAILLQEVNDERRLKLHRSNRGDITHIRRLCDAAIDPNQRKVRAEYGVELFEPRKTPLL